MEYHIYADEAWTQNSKPLYRYHAFFGGIMSEPDILKELEQQLRTILKSHNYRHEIKWSKLSKKNSHIYLELLACFKKNLEHKRIKYRQMFKDRSFQYTGDESEVVGQFKLYYQHLKYSYGLQFMPQNTSIYFMLDEHSSAFHKDKLNTFVSSLPSILNRTDLTVQIKFINSTHSRILQLSDLIMGAAGYYGNKAYTIKKVGQTRRTKLQTTKYQFGKAVYDVLREINNNERSAKAFNWFESTGMDGDKSNQFHHSIRIWKFVPREYIKDKTWENSKK